MPYQTKIRQEHVHLTLPSYLMDFIDLLAKKHNTSRACEIGTCVLLRYLNCGEL